MNVVPRVFYQRLKRSSVIQILQIHEYANIVSFFTSQLHFNARHTSFITFFGFVCELIFHYCRLDFVSSRIFSRVSTTVNTSLHFLGLFYTAMFQQCESHHQVGLLWLLRLGPVYGFNQDFIQN